MALDEFKTQVLLLHSEQSILDSLSSGFGASYTVHCATSGSEALNTLVDTPINVIVSAQNLPGMSGLEALREAKKRSPDTIGILLADGNEDDLEALVTDKEVFQIVRGDITNDQVLALVDNATQQVRLTMLAESANDTAGHDDDDTGEHIVMETADNGATLISDGSGKMRALNLAEDSHTALVGSGSVDLLVLTKDQEFLATIKESSRGMHTVHYATTLAQASETIQTHNVGVVVVDAAMVGHRVEQLTGHLRKVSARLVAVVAGRRDDGEMLMDLINRGKVYRFLLKPVSPGRVRLAIEASVKHHLEAPDEAFDASRPATIKPVSLRDTVGNLAVIPEPKGAAKRKSPPAPDAEGPATSNAPSSAAPTTHSLDQTATSSTSGESRVDDDLVGRFGEHESSFTETVAGLVDSVSKKLTGTEGTDASPGAADRLDTDLVAPPSRRPLMFGLAAVALVIVGVGIFWSLGDPEEPAAPEPTALPAAPSTAVPVDPAVRETVEIDVDDRLAEARSARDAGQLLEPPGNNAIELYAAAAAAMPGDELVANEFDAVIEQVLGSAEAALLESRLDEADAVLQRIATVDPDNSRLPLLTAQLSQMRLRDLLADTRTAIRESRFEDASNAIDLAGSLDVADNSEINIVADELSAALSSQRADDALSMAKVRLDDNALLSPPNDNARYYYELALSIDPENPVAKQGLSDITSKLASQARLEIDDGNLASAQQLLNEADALDPNNVELAAAVTALANQRDSIAAERRKVEAERLAAAEQQKAEAERLAAAEQKAAEERAEEALAAQAQAAPEMQEAAEPVAAADAAVPDGNEAASDEPVAEQFAKEDPAPSNTPLPQPANVTSLNRTKYVAPKYPRSAQRRNVSGWVDVVFTVTTDGTVKDIGIRGSEPGDTFVNAATKAVAKWEFEPVIENGRTVEKRVGVRMMFAVE